MTPSETSQVSPTGRVDGAVRHGQPAGGDERVGEADRHAPVAAPAAPTGRRPRPARTAGAAVAVFVLGAVLVMIEGRRGFMPLDQSIVFDAGWRMLDGQVPLRDFVAPNGFVPGAVQAVLFGLFGVSWWTYLLHAAVLNGLMGVLVIVLLVRLGLPLAPAAVYGAATTVVFHPPYGTPSIEQPSFFLALVGLALAVEAVRASGWWRRAALAAIPAAVALAVLSKQIPAALVVPVIAAVTLLHRRRGETLLWLLIGTGVVAATVGTAMAVLGVPVDRAVQHVWTLPRQVGAERFARSPSPWWAVPAPPWALLAPAVAGTGAALLAIAVTSGRRRRWVPAAVLAVAVALAVGVGVPSPPIVRGVEGAPARAPLPGAVTAYVLMLTAAWLIGTRVIVRARRTPVPRPPEPGVGPQPPRQTPPLPLPSLLVAPIAIVAVSTLFVAVTNNQIGNGAAYVFLALGLLDLALRAAVAGRHIALPAAAVVAVVVALPALAVGDAVRFHLDVNRTRVVHDFVFDPTLATGDGLPAAFDVAFAGPMPHDAQSFGSAVATVAATPGDVLLFGDSTIIAGLAGASSIAPWLWPHPGLVYPHVGAPGYDDMDERLATTLREPSVAAVLVEPAANPWRGGGAAGATGSPARPGTDADPDWARATTWTGAALVDFPRALAVIRDRSCGVDAIGAFTLVRLCGPPGGGASDGAAEPPDGSGDR